MDKRLLILIAIAVLSSGGFYAYRKLYFKPQGISYEIKPLGAIHTGDSISYSDKTAGAGRWKWDFGDGEFSADQNGYHTYLNSGNYNVTLTAYGSFGVQQRTEHVTVLSGNIATAPSGPSIIGPETAKQGVPAQWSSSADAGSYEWKVEGDAAVNAAQKTQSATFTFKSAGQRTLVLTTHKPDAVTRRTVMVVADAPQAAAPAKPAASAAIPMPPQQHAQAPAKPKPAPHTAQQHKANSNLEDLGDGVEIKK